MTVPATAPLDILSLSSSAVVSKAIGGGDLADGMMTADGGVLRVTGMIVGGGSGLDVFDGLGGKGGGGGGAATGGGEGHEAFTSVLVNLT